MCLTAPAMADTGFTNTIRMSETDNAPACTVGQIKVTAGTLVCNGQVATIQTAATPASPDQAIQFNNAGAFGGDSNLIWDRTAGALTLGGSTGDGTSWITINSGTAANPIYVKSVAAGANVINGFGAGTLGYYLASTGGNVSTQLRAIGAAGDAICGGILAGDSCLSSRRGGIPPWARSSRLFLQGDIEDDNSSTIVGPQIILSPKGAIVGPSDYPFTTSISTALAPLHVGYGSRNPNITNQKIVMDYPGDSKMIIIDSTTGHAGMFGIIASTIVVGSSSTANVQIWSNGVPQVTLSATLTSVAALASFQAPTVSTNSFLINGTDGNSIFRVDNTTLVSTDTLFNVTGSTSATWAMGVATNTLTGPWLLHISSTAVLDSQALCLLSGALGHCTSAVGAGGACTCVSP